MGDGPAVTYYVQSGVEELPNTSPYGAYTLDDPNSSTSNGTGIELWRSDGGANQRWTFVPLADGDDLIVNEASGLVLGDPGFSSSNGTGIIQWQLNDGLNEQWEIDPQGNGNVAIVNAYSNLALGDPGYSTSDGTQVIQWQSNGGLNRAIGTVAQV